MSITTTAVTAITLTYANASAWSAFNGTNLASAGNLQANWSDTLSGLSAQYKPLLNSCAAEINILEGASGAEEIGISGMTGIATGSTVYSSLFSLVSSLNYQNSNKKLRLIAGAIRNTGAGYVFISDSTHAPIGVSAVSSDDTTGRISITYDFEASKVIGFVVCPDEEMAAKGIFCGASVGTTYSYFEVYRDMTAKGYITKSGGSSPTYAINSSLSTGVTSAVATETNLTLNVTNETIDFDQYAYGEVYSRNTAIEAYIKSYGQSSLEIRFRRKPKVFGGYIAYNSGTSSFDISSDTGISSAVWDTNKLAITFDSSFTTMLPSVSTKSSNLQTSFDSFGGSTARIFFYDAAGTLITSPATSMKIAIVASEGCGEDIIPDDGTVIVIDRSSVGKMKPSSLSYSGSNFWFLGLMEVE